MKKFNDAKYNISGKYVEPSEIKKFDFGRIRTLYDNFFDNLSN